MAVVIDKDTCVGCEACVSTCPVDALDMADNKAVVNADECIDCGTCVDACPVEAISL